MKDTYIIIIVALIAIIGLGFMMTFSIKKHEVNKKEMKKKKGRAKRLPQSKNPGK